MRHFSFLFAVANLFYSTCHPPFYVVLLQLFQYLTYSGEQSIFASFGK